MTNNPSESSLPLYELHIDEMQPLSVLKSEFNSHFSFLKIEFFKAPHKIGEGSAAKLLYNDARLVKECRIRQVNGVYSFNELIKVSEFEDTFLHTYGLSVQVFRKSGNIWLETSATDEWTLRQQNEEGRELSSQIK